MFITHIKESLIPHPTGKTAREIIMDELRQLEERGSLGVEFVEVKRGDRICESIPKDTVGMRPAAMSGLCPLGAGRATAR